MGKRQKKKQSNSRLTPESQRVGAFKKDTASVSTMAPVQLSLEETTGDNSTCGSLVSEAEGTVCPHIENGINVEKLRARFAITPLQQCQNCLKRVSNKGKQAKAKVGNKVLWICLGCGHIGCGSHVSIHRMESSICVVGGPHARNHWIESQHPLVMQWRQGLDCWCLECKLQMKHSGIPDALKGLSLDESSNASIKLELLQKAATVLQERIFGRSSSFKVHRSELRQVADVERVSTPSTKHAAQAVSLSGNRRTIKGLMNLGNTCFFNSVMQNLVGVSMLREYFSREPSVQEGPLKLALRKFFQEMDATVLDRADGDDDGMSAPARTIRTRSFGANVGYAVSPTRLFSAICANAPRFKGFQQQDSHELLRCLLDGLHTEEESMRKAQLSAESPTEPTGELKEEGSHENPVKAPATFVEHVFGGQFASTVSCCECGHSSVVYEPFLDLSLPIPSKQERKAGSIRDQLSKSISERSRRGNLSSNGVLSIKPAGLSLSSSQTVDNEPAIMEGPNKLEKDPVSGCSLDGGAENSKSLNETASLVSGEEKGSSSKGGKDQTAFAVDPPVTSEPCEVISESVVCSSETNETDVWEGLVDESAKGTSKESTSGLVMDDQRNNFDNKATMSGASDSPQTNPDVETYSQEEFSTKIAEGVAENSPGETLSAQGDVEYQAEGGVEQLNNCCQTDEAISQYGPQLPDVHERPDDKQDCLDMVLPTSSTSGTSNRPLEVNDPANTSTSNSKAAENADSDGMGGLSDEKNDGASECKFRGQSKDSSSLSSSGSLRSVREVHSYPIMSLEGCLQAFTKTEVLSGENAWGCENCTKVERGQRNVVQTDALEGENACCSKLSPETERHSNEDGPTSISNTEAATYDTDREWNFVDDLNHSTNSSSIVVVPDVRDAPVEKTDQQDNSSIIESSTKEKFCQLNSEQNDEVAACRADVNLEEPIIVEPSSSNKSHEEASSMLSQSESLDESTGFRSVEAEDPPISGHHKKKEDTEDTYIMVESAPAVADESEDDSTSSTGRGRGKLRAKAGASKPKESIGKAEKRKLENDAPKATIVKRDATKRFLISKTPRVLTVHLKRFAQDLHGRLSKLSGHITFHEQLDLGPFMDKGDGTKQDGVYQLIGTVEHSGTMRGGHYVAYVKGSVNNEESEADDCPKGGSTWYYISDSHVRKTSLESVLQSEAYLLFYERRTFE